MNNSTNIIRRTALVVAGSAAGLAMATALVACGGSDSADLQSVEAQFDETPTTVAAELPEHHDGSSSEGSAGVLTDDDSNADPSDTVPPKQPTPPADPPVIIIDTIPGPGPTVQVSPPWVITEISDDVFVDVGKMPVVDLGEKPVDKVGTIPVPLMPVDQGSQPSNICQQFPELCDPTPVDQATEDDDVLGTLTFTIIGN